MKTRRNNAVEWWTGLPEVGKTFLRDLGTLMEFMDNDDVLELRRLGDCFLPGFVSTSGRPKVLPPEPPFPRMRPDGWWAGLGPAGKRSFRKLARIVWLLREGEVLQLSRSGRRIDLTLVLPVKWNWPGPVGGRAETN